MMSSMVKEKKNGKMDRHMQAVILKETRKVMECSNGLMEVFTKETSQIICKTDKVYMNGRMVESMMANGETLKCMEKANIIGQMEDDMKVIMKMI